jgi:hypothetical protein
VVAKMKHHFQATLKIDIVVDDDGIELIPVEEADNLLGHAEFGPHEFIRQVEDGEFGKFTGYADKVEYIGEIDGTSLR